MQPRRKVSKRNPNINHLLETVSGLYSSDKKAPFDLEEQLQTSSSYLYNPSHGGRQYQAEKIPSLFESHTSPLQTILQRTYEGQNTEMSTFFEQKKKKKMLIEPWEVVRRQVINNGAASEGQGLRRYEKVINHLRHFPQPPSLDQQRFIEAMFAVCLPHIFGPSDFEKHRKRLLRALKRPVFPWLTTIMCPRRWGKTVSVAMAVSVLMDVCENLRIVVVATGQKMSTALMKKIIEYYVQLTGNQKDREKRILVSNEKKFVVMHAGDKGTKKAAMETGRYNSIDACASTVHGFKGVSANIVLVDEASRVSEDLIVEGVSPLLTVKGTSLIMISTNLGEDNYFSQLFTNLPPSFEHQVIRFHVDLLCKECKENGDDPRLCDHNDHLRPPWLSVGNRERSTLFMTQHKYQQEVLGSIVQDGSGELSKQWVDQLCKEYLTQVDKIQTVDSELVVLLKHKKAVSHALQYQASSSLFAGDEGAQESLLQLEAQDEETKLVFQEFERKIESKRKELVLEKNALNEKGVQLESGHHLMYTFIDPAGGGLQSDYAAVSLVREFRRGGFAEQDTPTGRIVIVGLMTLDKKDQPLYEEHLLQYFEELLSQPLLKKASHFIGVESNYGGQPLAYHVLRLIERAGVPFQQLKDPTDTNQNHAWGLWTSKSTKMHGMAQLSKHLQKNSIFVCRKPLLRGRTEPTDVLRELSNQLKRLRYKNGKYTAKSFPDGKDDMTICLMLLFYYITINS